MRRIHLLVIAALMGLCFYLGYRFGDTRSRVVDDPKVITELKDSNKKLAAQRMWDEQEIKKLYASLKDDSIKFAAIEKTQKVLAWKIEVQKQEFKVQLEEIKSATLAKLDSFRWARYPDSVTVAKRMQQLDYENY